MIGIVMLGADGSPMTDARPSVASECNRRMMVRPTIVSDAWPKAMAYGDMSQPYLNFMAYGAMSYGYGLWRHVLWLWLMAPCLLVMAYGPMSYGPLRMAYGL